MLFSVPEVGSLRGCTFLFLHNSYLQQSNFYIATLQSANRSDTAAQERRRACAKPLRRFRLSLARSSILFSLFPALLLLPTVAQAPI